MSNGIPDHMYVIVPKEEVESDSIHSTSSYLKTILDRAAWATVEKRKVCDFEVTIDGYSGDTRELYEIQEVCEWARKEFRLIPSLGFFLTEKSRYAFCGWLCGLATKDEINSDSFLKRFGEQFIQFTDEGLFASMDILRSKGADEVLLSEIYIKNLQEIARARQENQLENRMADDRRESSVTRYVCDLCGQEFDRYQLDVHFVKTAFQASKILGTTWSGKLVTFDDDAKAWCPNCFKDAEAMRFGGRTVHQGERKPYLETSNLNVSYKCECGSFNTYHLRSVNIFNGLEVLCEKCEALLFVPPTIFDHSKNRGDGPALQSNFGEYTFFVWKNSQKEWRKFELWIGDTNYARNRKKLIETIVFLTRRKNWSPKIIGELMGKIEFGNYQILPDKVGKSCRIVVE